MDEIQSVDISQIVNSLTNDTINLAYKFVGLFILINAAYVISMQAFKKTDIGIFVKDTIIKIVVVTTILTIYLPLTSLVENIVYTVDGWTKVPAQDKLAVAIFCQTFKQKVSDGMDQDKMDLENLKAIKAGGYMGIDENTKNQIEAKISELEKEDSGLINIVTSTLSTIAKFFTKKMTGWFVQIIFMLNWLIALIIGGLAQVQFMLLKVIGPLAIAFSILPIFKDKYAEWLGTWLNSGFVLITFNIIDHFVIAMYNIVYGLAIKTGPGSMGIAFAIICISPILYLSVFWLTSKYVGSKDGGMIAGKTISTAITATAMTLNASAMMAGGGGMGSMGGGSAGGSILGKAGDIFKQD